MRHEDKTGTGQDLLCRFHLRQPPLSLGWHAREVGISRLELAHGNKMHEEALGAFGSAFARLWPALICAAGERGELLALRAIENKTCR